MIYTSPTSSLPLFNRRLSLRVKLTFVVFCPEWRVHHDHVELLLEQEVDVFGAGVHQINVVNVEVLKVLLERVQCLRNNYYL